MWMPPMIPILKPASFLLLACCALAGCKMESRVVSSTWDPMREIADPKPNEGRQLDPNDPRVRSPQGYAVELATFEGDDAASQAFALTSGLREQTGLGNLWYSDQGDSATVYAGRFRDPRSERATSALSQVRQANVAGERPYAGCNLVALSGGDNAVYNELDLRNHVGAYTLQIGFYDAQFGPDFRAAAETAVDILREEGDEAYFYHGPNRSLITVGLFSEREAFVQHGQTQAYSPAITQIKQRHPHNLMNGLTFERRENGIGGIQESSLVRVR